MRISFLPLLVLSLSAQAATTLPAAGQWEITNEVQAPLVGKRTKVVTRCLTEDQAKHIDKEPNRLIGDRQQQCDIQGFTRDGNTARWRFRCDGKLPIEGEAKVVFEGERYHGDATSKATSGMFAGMSASNQFSARRTGECAADADPQKKAAPAQPASAAGGTDSEEKS